MTAALQNPWLSYSAANPFPAEQAVAPLPNPLASGAAADQLACSSAVEQGAVNAQVAGSSPAMPATDLLGCRIDDVGNIFTYARWLCAQARIEPGKYSPEAVAVAEEIREYEGTYYDPPPLFLQTPGGILQVLRGR